MPAYIRTLSQLPEVTGIQLNKKSKLEVSVPVSIDLSGDAVLYKFASKSITVDEFSKKMLSTVRDNLVESNGLSDGVRIDDLCATVLSIAESDFTFNGVKKFNKNPLIDNSNLSSYSFENSELDDYSVNYGTLKKYTSINASPSIGPNFGFVTLLSGIQGESTTGRYLNIFKPGDEEGTFSNKPNFIFNTNVKNVVPNEYIFKIERGAKSSNEWMAPASGIFTCYGWLDEMNNPAQANDSRWVALMGKQAQIEEWTILQLQPFDKNNYLSYVGFTFPVKKGMLLKIVTGFAVGSNSDKYFAASNSLANHVGNAFLGGVYTGLSADYGDGGSYEYGDVSGVYVTSADLSGYVTREEEDACDLSVKGMIDDLSSKISTLVIPDPEDPYDDTDLWTALKYKVRYIDPSRLSAGNLINSRINFGTGTKVSAGGKYGAFTNGVVQELFNGDTSRISAYTCLSIDFTLDSSRPFSVKDYYAPPTKTETRNNRTGYVERGYFITDIPPGQIASDGQYYYYKVSQNSTVLIKHGFDVASPGSNIIICWLLYDLNRGYANIKAMPVLEKREIGFYNGNPCESISIPLMAGSILMFGVYGRENISDMPWYMNCLQPPVITLYSPAVIKSLVDLKESSNSLSFDYNYFVDAAGTRGSRKAILIRADAGNLGVLYSNNPTAKQFRLSDSSFGTVAAVYELP